MVWKIEAHLPPGWLLAEYSELNHHITIVDAQGRQLRLEAEHVVRYQCQRCGEEMFARSNHGQILCPCGYTMTSRWSRSQVAFIPGLAPDDDETTDPEVLLPKTPGG